MKSGNPLLMMIIFLITIPFAVGSQTSKDSKRNAKKNSLQDDHVKKYPELKNAALAPDKLSLGSIFDPMQLREISVWSPTYPVLAGKSDNPVMRIQIDVTGFDRALQVTEMLFDLNGSDDVKDIAGARIYYTGSSPDFNKHNLFGESTVEKERLTFQGVRYLQPGENYFWLSLTLKENIDLLHQLGLQFLTATINGQPLSASASYDYPRKRLGYALRQHNDDGVHTFRIPGLVTTNTGTLIAVYDVRRLSSVDLQGDIDIGMNRSTDGGQTWEPMRIILDRGEWGGLPQDQNGVGDPAVLFDPITHTIWVAGLWAHGHPDRRSWFASQKGIMPEQTNQLVLVKSVDDGLTWSEPINITSQIKNPDWHLLLQGPGRGIAMKDGTLVFPAQFKDADQTPFSTIIYSKDHGVNWQIGVGAKSHTTEAQVVELDDGALMLNMRDDRGTDVGGQNGTGARSVFVSRNLGASWEEHPTSRKALPEPVCMAGFLKHTIHSPKGRQSLLLFSNPRHRYFRENITIQVSKDEGMSWPEKNHLLLDEGRGRGYSCMTIVREDVMGILYEGSQADLIFQLVYLKDLIGE